MLEYTAFIALSSLLGKAVKLMNLSSVSSCFFDKWALGENCHIWLNTWLTLDWWLILRRKMLRPSALLCRWWFKTVEHWLNWLTKYRHNMKMRNGMSDGKRTITTLCLLLYINSADRQKMLHKNTRKLAQNWCCLSDFSNGWNKVCWKSGPFRRQTFVNWRFFRMCKSLFKSRNNHTMLLCRRATCSSHAPPAPTTCLSAIRRHKEKYIQEVKCPKANKVRWEGVFFHDTISIYPPIRPVWKLQIYADRLNFETDQNLFLFFFCLLCIRFQTQQSEEENRFRIVFRIHSQQQRFDFLSFLLALIQILRLLGEFNSHSLHSACFGKQQMPKNQREFVYYYIKGIFIFLLSDILRWKYAVWRCTSVVKKTGLRPYRYV